MPNMVQQRETQNKVNREVVNSVPRSSIHRLKIRQGEKVSAEELIIKVKYKKANKIRETKRWRIYSCLSLQITVKLLIQLNRTPLTSNRPSIQTINSQIQQKLRTRVLTRGKRPTASVFKVLILKMLESWALLKGILWRILRRRLTLLDV